ncbi:enoyl-CoA hydratase-related protein [Roseobacteraceae bacterium S113]
MSKVQVTHVAQIAVLRIDNPPVNALSHAVRRGLWDALEAAEADADVGAVVIAAEGRTFPAGADISEFGTPLRAPGLSELCIRIEACTKPVVAALHGTAFGGGFELALAAHYRVAQRGTRLAFPEVRLGIPPGAGGTQRAPRLAGAKGALALMLSGQPLAVISPNAAPYIDRLTDGDPAQAAQELARDLVDEGAGARRTSEATAGFADPVAYQMEIDRQKQALRHHPEPARLEIVRAVEAALLLPLDAGLAFESAAFDSANVSPQARALQHMFFADRAAAKPPTEGQVRATRQLGLAGGGRVAVALGMAALEAGLAVVQLAPNATGQTSLKLAIDTALDARRMTAAAKTERLERLVQSQDPTVLAGCEIVIGCGPHQGQLIAATSTHLPAQTALATTLLYPLVQDSPVLGLSMSEAGNLAEVLWSDQSKPDDVASLMALLRHLGRDPVAQASVKPLSEVLSARLGALVSVVLEDGWPPDALRDAGRAQGVALSVPDTADPDAQVKPQIADPMRFILAGVATCVLALWRAGRLSRISDVDVLATRDLGFARWSGGPMHMAAAGGLLRLQRDIMQGKASAPDLFEDAPELDHLIKSGESWAALSRP